MCVIKGILYFSFNHWNLKENWSGRKNKVGNLEVGFAGEESASNVGNPGLIPGLGRSPEEGNGNSLQYSCLENPMERGAWQATPWGGKDVWQSHMTEWLSLSSGILNSVLSFANKYLEWPGKVLPFSGPISSSVE